MLTVVEKMLFVILAALALGASYAGFADMARIVRRGGGQLQLDRLAARAWQALAIYLTQRTTLKTRRLSSLLHWGIVLGFTWYFLVNLIDLLVGFMPRFDATLAAWGGAYDAFRLISDVVSILVLAGIVYFVSRRLVLPSRRALQFHDNILLHPRVKSGDVTRDSLIVAAFILVHVGARFLGESVSVAQHGYDAFMPFASAVSPLWASLNHEAQMILRHLFWWLALGGILLFLPYFPQSKHAHLFMAPLNFLTRPERQSMGELPPLDFEDESVEQFGAGRLEDLHKTHILDGFACIMCNRCQDVCPAYLTGKELSPSALEINKRFTVRDNWHSAG